MKEKLMDEISRAIAKKFGSSCIAEFFEIVKDGNAVVPTAVISVPYMTPCLAVHIGSLLQGLEEGKDSLEGAAQVVSFGELFGAVFVSLFGCAFRSK